MSRETGETSERRKISPVSLSDRPFFYIVHYLHHHLRAREKKEREQTRDGTSLRCLLSVSIGLNFADLAEFSERRVQAQDSRNIRSGVSRRCRHV